MKKCPGRSVIWLIAGLCSSWAGLVAGAQDAPRTAGPYVPTPQVIVDRMLSMAQVGAKDFVVDLGSGDGRMVRTAAKALGASGFGVDIDGELVELSNQIARKEGVANRVTFYEQDVFKADIRKATVVTLYVLPDMMVSLRPKLLSELNPGTRIVSHDYHFREWIPDNRVTFDVPEKREMVGFSSTSLYLWIVPASVGGRWRVEYSGAKPAGPVTLDLSQLYQYFNGTALVGSRKTEIANAKMRGNTFEFALDPGERAGGDRYLHRGTVVGDTMQGEVQWGSGVMAKRYAWKATRIDAPSVPLAQ